jgi:hypothetical protein
MEEMDETCTDFTGRTRHFTTRLQETPGGLCAEAVEKGKEDGYRFKVVVAAGATGQALWELREKMHRTLNTRHLEKDERSATWRMTHDVLRGRIAYGGDHAAPKLVVDGKPLTWEEVGRMMDAYEGFEFELRILS